MDPFKARNTKMGPEAIRQRRIMKELRGNGWFARSTHGNEYQAGFPDIFASHVKYGPRWIEVKNDENWRLEESQLEVFRKFAEKKIGVWIMQDADDYSKLLQPPNWWLYTDVMKVVTRTRAKKNTPWQRQTRIASKGPEREIQEALKSELTRLDWYVLETHGNLYQNGWPDLYACHREYGGRWIEVKRPTGSTFTSSQIENFPLMVAHGAGVWVLTGSDEIPKLFQPCNWYFFLQAMK